MNIFCWLQFTEFFVFFSFFLALVRYSGQIKNLYCIFKVCSVMIWCTYTLYLINTVQLINTLWKAVWSFLSFLETKACSLETTMFFLYDHPVNQANILIQKKAGGGGGMMPHQPVNQAHSSIFRMCIHLKKQKSESWSHSRVQLFLTPWTAACPAPLSLKFSR